MIHCKSDEIYKPKFVLIWMLLSLKAGYLNAAGLLTTGYFVSHVTGFGTNIGVSIAHKDYIFGIELLIIPFAFIIGSSIPSWVLDRDYDKNVVPKYHYVQFLITLGLGLLFYLGINGTFGDFTTSATGSHVIILIGTLCLVCGMKNGLTTWATEGKIRTTHLTGLSTDIGLHLPQTLGRKGRSKFDEQKKVNIVRMLTFISFSSGSLIAAIMLPTLNFWGFLFPFVTSLVLLTFSYASYLNQMSLKRRRTYAYGK